MTPGSGSADGRVPPRLVLAELRKAGTTNLWWILGVCALVSIVLSLVANGAFAVFEMTAADSPDLRDGGGGEEPDFIEERFAVDAVLVRHAASISTSGQYFGLLIVMLFGILMVTNEFRHQTASSTFLATPRRSKVVVAKLVTAVAVAAGAWLVTTLIAVASAIVFFDIVDRPYRIGDWAVQRSIAMNLLAYALWALLGIGLGALIRNQIGATVTGVVGYVFGGQVVPLVFVLALFVFEQTWLLQLIVLAPSVANQVMVSPERLTLGDINGELAVGPQWWVGALVLLGYGVITAAIGTMVLRHRDVS